jgi:RNA polymerase sigma-70 factor (ECF subfamily)
MVRPEDFTRMVDATLPAVSRYALRRTPSSADAEEVVAETFAVAWRRRHDMPDVAAALPWLYAVARRVLANGRRSARRWDRLQAKAGGLRAAEPANPDQIADGQPIRDALARLPEADAELLRLLAWEQLSHAEAALVLDTTENAVALRASRARRKLAEMLDDRSSNVVDMEGRATRRRTDVG